MAAPPDPGRDAKDVPARPGVTAKLAVTGSAVLLLIIGALVAPLGGKLVDAVWPAKLPTSPTAPTSNQPAVAAAATGGCVANGPALSVTVTYDFSDARWWATKEKLPDDIAGRLDEAEDPATVLAPYQPVEMELSAGTALKLLVTGCGPNRVTITNMHAVV